MIGRLQRVPLRQVWPHEALDFTRWLEENIDVINEVTGLSLSEVRREQAAGAFSVDLVVDDGSGAIAVVENQLERSDHDHLGKLITYLSAFDAKVAVWIVAEPRPEHAAAVTWLNQSTAASFYLLKVEAVRIAGSPPAPLITLIVGPSPESRAVGETKQEFAEHHQMMRQFWSGLLDLANARTSLHRDASPAISNWLSAGSGISGVFFNYIVRADDARVELYIDVGDHDANRRLFDQLHAHREQVEAQLDGELHWDRREGRSACKIEYPVPCSGYRARDRWRETQQAMVEAMGRFEQALRPAIGSAQL